MGDTLIKRTARWGISGAETTIGTAIDATTGLPVMNDAVFMPNQEWVDAIKSAGITVPSTKDNIVNGYAPTFAPQLTMFYPDGVVPFSFGELCALLTQNVSESGSGPYVQTIEPDTSTGKSILFGSSGALGNNACTLWQDIGQTGNRAIAAAGAVVSRIDVTIPERGLVTVTPTFNMLTYDDADSASGGTFTLPLQTAEKTSRDFVYKIGDGTPSSLHSRELSFSLIADITPRWYAGLNGYNPYKIIYHGWRLEGSFSKPIAVAADTLSKSYVVEGGDVSSDLLMYVYSTTMTDYNEAAASLANGEMRFTFNIRINDAPIGGDDETVEIAAFEGRNDGTNNIFKIEQCTTATQGWAT